MAMSILACAEAFAGGMANPDALELAPPACKDVRIEN